MNTSGYRSVISLNFACTSQAWDSVKYKLDVQCILISVRSLFPFKDAEDHGSMT